MEIKKWCICGTMQLINLPNLKQEIGLKQMMIISYKKNIQIFNIQI